MFVGIILQKNIFYSFFVGTSEKVKTITRMELYDILKGFQGKKMEEKSKIQKILTH